MSHWQMKRLPGSTLPDRSVSKSLTCPCSEVITSENDDVLIEKSMEHLRRSHPEISDDTTRNQILFMLLLTQYDEGSSYLYDHP